MTSILGQVTSGGPQAGQRIVIAGQEKVGKTTLACGAPGALLIPLETDPVAMARYAHTPQLTNWQQVKQLCEELRAGAMNGQIKRGSSLVWDSATALERIIHNEVIMTDPKAAQAIKAGVALSTITMEKVHEGYGKAYAAANDFFATWMRYMDELATYGGINIIVTCHVFPARIVDPTSGEFDTWDLLLHSPRNNRTYGKRELITQWADMIGFLHEPNFVMKAEKGETVQRAISANQGRQLAVSRTPAWVAGNRYGLNGVIPIPEQNGWQALAMAIGNSTQGRVDLRNSR